MMDALIEALRRETAAELTATAKALWENQPPPASSLPDNLATLLTLAAVNEASPGDTLETYTDGEFFQRYATGRDRAFRTVFKEAIAALKRKSPILTVMSPRGLDEATRQTAFFVSSVMQANIVQKIKDTLLEARTHGKSLSDFLQQVAHTAELSAPHIETVFRTNVMSAAGAARKQQFEDPDVASLFVAYRYVSKADARGHPYIGTRPLHAAMNGFIAVKDDPIWAIIWTPNGYNCRCAVRGVRKAQAIEAGLMSSEGVIIAPRVFATQLQRLVVDATLSGGGIDVEGKVYVFPDEGFRGNALAP